MTWFVDDSTALAPVIAGNRSRAVGAGVDPFQYDEITRRLGSLRQWLPAFAAAAARHAQLAQSAEDVGRFATAATAWRSAAVCWHIGTTMPDPDTPALHQAAASASLALTRYLDLRGGVTYLTGGTNENRYVGELRQPSDVQSAPVAVILPGLDSSRTEFLDLTEALLDRGVAVAAIDGPGQGALVDQAPTANYHLVVSQVLDELQHCAHLDPRRIAVVGLSLGGIYAQLAAAHDPRITAVTTVSGPVMPTWDLLPPFAIDTLQLRLGDLPAAQDFAHALHETDVAAQICQPLLIVSGTDDNFPTPDEAKAVADTATNAVLSMVEQGDHLCGNTRWRWLSQTSDWLADQLHVL